jgi:hypothetical protein
VRGLIEEIYTLPAEAANGQSPSSPL